jgi:hypothetical protein
LREGLAASVGRDIVGFIDNGMTGGDVSSVIESLSSVVKEAGKTPRLYNTPRDFVHDYASHSKGSSIFYGAVEFLSSPDQGTNQSAKGYWNYTIYGDYSSGVIDVRNNNNFPKKVILPLQRAVDTEIIARSPNATSLPPIVHDITYTSDGQDTLNESSSDTYLFLCATIFGIIFGFTMICFVSHITSFVATEREMGMSELVDAMLPGGSLLRARLIRQVSTYLSFVLIYLPGWAAVGIIISIVGFPETSRGIPAGYNIFSGLAFSSFSLFGAAFFKKAHLSGSIMVITTLVFAILPQVVLDQPRGLVMIFSLLFPSANYTYFITSLALWELSGQDVDLMKASPENYDYGYVKRLEMYLYWLFVIIQILVYPILAFCVEHLRFSAASPGRVFSLPSDTGGPTVRLSNFCKT